MEPSVGIVVIGRNPGTRLHESLQTALKQAAVLVYVDSGSTDDSVSRAHLLGIPVIILDDTQPYTAARARNAGAQFLLREHPTLEFIQFVDGDCLLADNFIARALEIMRANAAVAVVGGQRRERFPKASMYHRLMALEWESPVGEIEYCGGDAFVRATAFQEVNGYNPRLDAGEEPEMCLRLRRAGWKIWGIPDDMTIHDSGMTQFAQWWKRNVRAGHAYAQGAWMHGRGPERHWVRESASIWLWGAGVSGAAFVLSKRSRGASIALLSGYLLLVARIYKRARSRGWSVEDARAYAFFCVLGKFPQLQGQLLFLAHYLRGQD